MSITASDRNSHHLAAIVSSSDDAIISKDLNGTVTSWNGAAERMFGYTAEEAIGQSIRLIIPHDRQREEDEVLRRIRAGKSVTHFETERLRKNGTVIPISLTISPIFDAERNVIGASKIARDISERKSRETQLAAIEGARADLHARLLMLVAASTKLFGTPHLTAVVAAALHVAADLVPADAYVIWRLRQDTGWLPLGFDGVSPDFARITSALGKTELDFTEPVTVEDVLKWPAGAPRRDAYIQEGIASMLIIPLVLNGLRQGAFVFYHRMPHRYSEVDVNTAAALGNLTAAAVSNAELFDEHQRVVRAGVLADVLRCLATPLNYQEMLSHIVSVFVPRIADWCAVDLIGKDMKVERVAAAHVDESKGAMIHELRRRFPDIEFTPGASGSVMTSGQSVFVRRVTDDMLVAAFPDSEERLRLVRALGIGSYMCVPLVGQRGVIGAIAFVLGESGRHFVQDDLLLVQELGDRTALAIESAQAYEEAQRANRIKDNFLATLSHELRTPLNAILGYTWMLRANALADDRREHALETVERNAKTVSRMLYDLLDVSRIASGKLTLTMQLMDLRTLVLESVESVAPKVAENGLSLQVDTEKDPVLIQGDRARLQQVVWNLLSNALKFTPAGGRINVTVKSDLQTATIVVQDSGIGIAPAFQSRVFEPFQQIRLKSTPQIGGLGLGLAIVHQIVELHGGSVTLQSEGEGKGSTFTVRLPRHGSLRHEGGAGRQAAA
ncbi:MAG TPA: PAS domain S-box protein [Vicinamibacterales bacterium]|nr:PAS domain S-box protein [Vicinamibacterales bacterium]